MNLKWILLMLPVMLLILLPAGAAKGNEREPRHRPFAQLVHESERISQYLVPRLHPGFLSPVLYDAVATTIAPSTARVTLLRQAEKERHVLHLLHYIPEHRYDALREALEAALGLLSERERAVFVLREMEGLETRDVARTLGITTITVRRHLSRARSRIREILKEIGITSSR